MKQYRFLAACIVLFTCIAVSSVFGDQQTISLESIIIDPFDGSSDYEWKHFESKFATKGEDEDSSFPKLAYVSAYPVALRYLHRDSEDDVKSLGVWGKFDRQGYNWIDLYPVQKEGEEDAGPYEIPLRGRVQLLDIWVWGARLNYYIEAYVRDYRGVVHVIPMGDIGFAGWKNLRANVPTHIPQSKKQLPDIANLKFVKFRIWTRPTEKVDNFYIYFNRFKILSDTFESFFDGDELADPANVQKLWDEGEK